MLIPHQLFLHSYHCTPLNACLVISFGYNITSFPILFHLILSLSSPPKRLSAAHLSMEAFLHCSCGQVVSLFFFIWIKMEIKFLVKICMFGFYFTSFPYRMLISFINRNCLVLLVSKPRNKIMYCFLSKSCELSPSPSLPFLFKNPLEHEESSTSRRM